LVGIGFGGAREEREEIRKPGYERPLRSVRKLEVDGGEQPVYAYLYETDANSDQRAGLFAYRSRSTRNDGSGFGVNFTNTAITAANYWGDSYTFGLAGYCYNDYPLSGGIIGAQWNADYWGALGYRDENYDTWGVYTPSNVYIGGTLVGGALNLREGAGEGFVLTSDSEGNATWRRPEINGYLGGTIRATGTVHDPARSISIDHPLDPENMYLNHAAVESPDMMNVYNGNIILDSAGEAWVSLPPWFEMINRDFRYQLTCVGRFAPVFVADKVSGNRFKIAGGEPGMEVSWQVTGVRKDPYAESHRIAVEEIKGAGERGRYLHPELYGMPESMRIQRTTTGNDKEGSNKR
jgi:hypothetical protein